MSTDVPLNVYELSSFIPASVAVHLPSSVKTKPNFSFSIPSSSYLIVEPLSVAVVGTHSPTISELLFSPQPKSINANDKTHINKEIAFLPITLYLTYLLTIFYHFKAISSNRILRQIYEEKMHKSQVMSIFCIIFRRTFYYITNKSKIHLQNARKKVKKIQNIIEVEHIEIYGRNFCNF